MGRSKFDHILRSLLDPGVMVQTYTLEREDQSTSVYVDLAMERAMYTERELHDKDHLERQLRTYLMRLLTLEKIHIMVPKTWKDWVRHGLIMGFNHPDGIFPRFPNLSRRLRTIFLDHIEKPQYNIKELVAKAYFPKQVMPPGLDSRIVFERPQDLPKIGTVLE